MVKVSREVELWRGGLKGMQNQSLYLFLVCLVYACKVMAAELLVVNAVKHKVIHYLPMPFLEAMMMVSLLERGEREEGGESQLQFNIQDILFAGLGSCNDNPLDAFSRWTFAFFFFSFFKTIVSE